MAMSSAGLSRKDHCAGEAQQQFSSQLMEKATAEEDRPPPLGEEELPLLNTHSSRREQNPCSYISTAPEVKCDCAAEDQGQFNRQTDESLKYIYTTFEAIVNSTDNCDKQVHRKSMRSGWMSVMAVV
jgi:hypothetical protein